jgi:hypothetical protein
MIRQGLKLLLPPGGCRSGHRALPLTIAGDQFNVRLCKHEPTRVVWWLVSAK